MNDKSATAGNYAARLRMPVFDELTFQITEMCLPLGFKNLGDAFALLFFNKVIRVNKAETQLASHPATYGRFTHAHEADEVEIGFRL